MYEGIDRVFVQRMIDMRNDYQDLYEGTGFISICRGNIHVQEEILQQVAEICGTDIEIRERKYSEDYPYEGWTTVNGIHFFALLTPEAKKVLESQLESARLQAAQ